MEKKETSISWVRLVRNFYKLAQQIHEWIPAKKRVYFLYTHKNGFDRYYNGLKANTEISYWVYRALRSSFPRVRFLRFQGEKLSRIRKIRPQDVVVGHVGPTFELAGEQTRRLIAFNPWVGDEDHSREGFNCIPKEIEIGFYDKAAALIFLTSEFNKREYFEKPRNFWYAYFQEAKKQKRIRIVHQPIDLNVFKRIKWDYTTNNFLYIGNDGFMKGVPDAIDLVNQVGRKLYLYGLNGNKIDHRDANQVNKLPLEADFFIQPGLWEAQCVSILESAARGFIPIVTAETGYPYQHPFLLKLRDKEYNLKILKMLLRTTPQERQVLANQLHIQLIEDENHNNWTRLTDVIVEEVKQMFSQNIEMIFPSSVKKA